MTENLVFLAGKRTPFGSNGGTLRDVNPTDLALVAARAALDQARVFPQDIDHTIVGNVLHSTPDSIYTPRHLGLRLGIPESVPALGINRLCGSGFQTVVEAYQQMTTGDTKIALLGGVENMSLSPFVLRGTRWGAKMGHQQIYDVILECLFDTYAGFPMALTAENLAEKYKISREEADAFALRGQKLYKEAAGSGKFKDEIVPFSWEDKRGKAIQLNQDEHPKPDTDSATLAKLKPVFKKDGTVTAGNASGIVDGAAALIVSTENEAKRRNLTPLGRMVSYGIMGCDPKIMGIGPVPAAKEALRRAGMSLQQMDLVEVNEAFAPQALAVERELGIDREVFNVNGGAIAIGHPLAASGIRITMHLLYELRRRKKKYGLGSACIGGGQGIALVVEAY